MADADAVAANAAAHAVNAVLAFVKQLIAVSPRPCAQAQRKKGRHHNNGSTHERAHQRSHSSFTE
jgi:hypothetical protein